MVLKSFAPLMALLLCLFPFQKSLALEFPTNPSPQLTPGQLCHTPDSYRYPEKIPYCDRDVSPFVKKEIIENYDRAFGYHIEALPREQFKIDHYIPLCMGGSNDISNLWPQHVSVYTITDSLEEAVCTKMSEGKLRQKEAVQIIITAKQDLKQVPAAFNYLSRL